MTHLKSGTEIKGRIKIKKNTIEKQTQNNLKAILCTIRGRYKHTCTLFENIKKREGK